MANHPELKIVALDIFDMKEKKPFEYVKQPITRENVKDLTKIMGLSKGDILIDLSTNIFCLESWPACSENGVMYINTAMEEYAD